MTFLIETCFLLRLFERCRCWTSVSFPRTGWGSPAGCLKMNQKQHCAQPLKTTATSSFAEWASLENIWFTPQGEQDVKKLWWSFCDFWLKVGETESSLGRAETKHIQEPHNPKTRHNVSTAKARRWKISLVWRQQTSEPWKPHSFSPAQSVCKAEGFFLFFFLRVAANETSADVEEHRHTHHTNPMGQVSTSFMCTNHHLNDIFLNISCSRCSID